MPKRSRSEILAEQSRKQAKASSQQTVRSRSKPPKTSSRGLSLNYGYQAPAVHFRSERPISKGACVRYLGVDYAGTISSSSAAALSGSAYALRPSASATFPRLFAIQDVFLRWHLRRLRFHFIGRSAATQPGVGSFASFVTDGTTALINIATPQTIKNAEGCLTLKGWENGVHEVDVDSAGVKWYNTDGDTLPSQMGNLGQTVPQTTANGDLSWDVFVEYDCEFAEAIDTSSVSPLLKEKQVEKDKEETAESLGFQLIKLRKKLAEIQTTQV